MRTLIEKKHILPLTFFSLLITLGTWTSGHLLPQNTQKAQTQRLPQTTFQLHPQVIKQTLGYKGTVKADVSESITSPYAGVIAKIYKRYGDSVQKGEVIMSIDSSTFSKEYVKTVIEYHQAKNKLEKALTKQTHNQNLFKDGIIAQNELTQSEEEVYDQRVKTLDLQKNLYTLAKVAQIPIKTIESINIQSSKDLDQLLNQDFHIPLRATESGVVLSAEAFGSESKDNSLKSLIAGKPIAQDQVAVGIASPSKLLVELQVPEQDIEHISPDTVVEIYSNLNPYQKIKATVASINTYQSQKNHDGSIGFPVTIQVSCTDSTTCPLNIGSQVRVEMQLASENALSIPFSAISSSAPFRVKGFDEGSKTWKDLPIEVIKTTPTHAIIKGLNVGQTISTHY